MTTRASERKPLLPQVLERQPAPGGTPERNSTSPDGSYTDRRRSAAASISSELEDDTLATASSRAARKVPAVLLFLGVFMLLFVLFDIGLEQRKQKSAPPLGLPKKVQKRWGQYSPYMPAGKYKPPPNTCVINQVNIVRMSQWT